MKKSLMNKIYFIALIVSISASFVFGQTQYTKERYLVEVGWQVGKFPPDTSGIRKAFDAAASLRESGKFVTVQFAPGVYQLDSTFIKLRDSVNVNFNGKVVFRGKHVKGIFSDDSIRVASIWNGNPEMINTSDNTKQLVLKNGSSSVSYLAGSSEGASWGSITGTLSSQSDLNSALSAKFNHSDTSNYYKKTHTDALLNTKFNRSDTSSYYPKTMMNALLATKENSIASGTTGQYLRGDKTWQTLNKNAVGLPNVEDYSLQAIKDSTLKDPLIEGPMGTEALYSTPVNLGTLIANVDWKTSNMFYATVNDNREFNFLNTQEGQVITLDLSLTSTSWTITFTDTTVYWPEGAPPTAPDGVESVSFTFYRMNNKIKAAYVYYLPQE